MSINDKIEIGQTKETVPGKCLHCDTVLDAATCATGDRAPSEGDITICFYCGHVMAFADDAGNMRELNDEELYEVAGNPTILKIQKARRLAFDSLNRRNDADSGGCANKEGLEDS